jgi:hypothetical protein
MGIDYPGCLFFICHDGILPFGSGSVKGYVSRGLGLMLVTEWKTFRQPDFKHMGQLMRQKIIFDGRNQYDPHPPAGAAR